MAVDTSPLKRVTAGRGGKTAVSPPFASRTWYSSLPAGGWWGSAATRSAPARAIGRTVQSSLLG